MISRVRSRSCTK